MTADSNDHRASNIRSSAQRPIPDATAYMTGATSRETVTLQTKVTSESTDNRQRLSEIRRKKDFCFIDRINGKNVNILEGLELHRNVFNNVEQKELIDYVYQLQELGRNQKLRRRTYSEPRKWMRGKGRVTLQFGCCYNYAIDKDGNPPGIIREEEVDAIPQKFRMVIKRLVEWHVLPAGCIPDSCIVNIYDVGDCIPPHIDHHDFVRPFCTLSLLSECNIIFGTELKIAGPGEFIGSYSIPLPTGSVLILNGNGADVAKHAVPAVPTKRISITFRKMDPTKVPESFKPDKELLSTKPLANGGSSKLNLSTGSTGQIPDVGHLKLNAMSLNSANGTNAQGRISEKPQFSLENDFPALQISKTPSMPAVKGRLRSSRT
ncbi:hypothetical protein KP509_11G007300 [Ceratopteris richardii]|nr:hypothetical protein KP509_11G007300 [Ceratopteris richardii]